MAHPGAAVDPHRGVGFQPLLVVGAVVGYLPIAASDPADRAVLLAVSAAFAVTSLIVWRWGRRTASPRVRSRIGLGLGAASLVAYVVMLQRADAAGIPDLLPLGVLLITAFAFAPAAWSRVGLQTMVVVVVAVRLWELQTLSIDTAATVLLLAVVAGVVDVFAADLTRARSAQRRARRSADRRSRLLTAVGQLLGRSPDRATEATVDTLRGMGFRDVEVVMTPPAAPVAGTAVRVAGTVVPVPVAGAPAGAIVVARHDGAALGDDERDVVEVLAAQLAGAWEADARVGRQRELLRRMTDLERTRRGFLDAVSDELHAPLGLVRDAVDTLNRPAAAADARTRDAALATLIREAGHLGTTITAVFDASLMVAAPAGDDPVTDGVPRIETVAVADLLAPFERRTMVRGTPPDGAVLVAAEPMKHALDLWLTRSAVDGPATLVVDADPDGLLLQVVAGRPGALDVTNAMAARSLVARLVVAAGGRWRTEHTAVLPAARALDP